MEVILLENIENLGSVGDKVNVKAGFARNYLVPHGKAKMATAENLAEFEARRAELEAAAAEARLRFLLGATARERSEAMEGLRRIDPGEAKELAAWGPEELALLREEAAGEELRRRYLVAGDDGARSGPNRGIRRRSPYADRHEPRRWHEPEADLRDPPRRRRDRRRIGRGRRGRRLGLRARRSRSRGRARHGPRGGKV